MKKGIIVLLITVLAAGMVFAGTLTGSANISFGFNLDSKNWGFANSDATAKYSFTFAVDTASAATSHETNIWAEAEANATAVIMEDDANGVPCDLCAEVEVTKANIHINEVTIGILSAGGNYDYSKHPFLKGADKKVIDLLQFGGKAADGFTVSYKVNEETEWKGGFGAEGNTKDETYTIFAHIETPAFKFVEGLSTQAAAYAVIKDNDGSIFGGAVKASYVADKLSADAAADLQYAAEKFNYEANAHFGYDFVNAYAYIAPNGDDTRLDAKVAATYTITIDDVNNVVLNGYAQTTDVLVDAREIEFGVDATATIKPVTLFGKVSYAIYAKKLGLEGKVTYTHEVFTAYADLKADIQLGDDSALLALKPELSISSEKIVENATLALTWKGADFAKNEKDEITKKGAITASATIEF